MTSQKQTLRRSGKKDWTKWLKHWDTWSAVVAEVRPPSCGMFGCDEKVKISRGRWKCIACGKVTTTEQELEPKDNWRRGQ